MTGRRALGRTGIAVSTCTLGTATWATHDPADVAGAVERAFDRGVHAVELDIGDAAAVALLGPLVARRDRDISVFARPTSLVPFDLPSPHVLVQDAYPGRRLRLEVEALLARLGIDRLALVLLHAWCAEWLDEGDWLETLVRLRAEGKIAGIGISLFDHDVYAAAGAVASGHIDAVEMMVNVFDQGAAASLLPLCHAHGVSVIARSPLYYGALAGPRLPAFMPSDWRDGYFFDEHRRETDMRVQRLAAALAPDDGSVAEVALRYCLAQEAVATVAVGMSTAAHVDATLTALARGPLTAAACAALKQHRWLC